MASVLSLPRTRRDIPAWTPAESPKTAVIACLTPRCSRNAELLRKSQLAARESGGAFYAVLLDSRTRFGKVQAGALDDVVLASYFGAKIVWLKSSDAVGELIQFARKTEAGRIFVARNQPHPFLRPFGRGVYSELLNRGEGFRIDVVGLGQN